MVGSAALVFEVQTGGSDSNGGGFDSSVSSPGTDYSQQASAQVTYTDLVIDATNNAKLTSAAHPFNSTHVGNVINISGGTGFTAGLYCVESVSGNVATMDNSVGSSSSTGGTGKLGGAFASINAATSYLNIGGQTIYVKSGTYQITTSVSFLNLIGSNTLCRLIGYTSTRGDDGRATIQINANSVTMGTVTMDNTIGVSWENFIFDGNNKTSSNGFNLAGLSSGYTLFNFSNCIFKQFKGQYCIVVPDGTLNVQNCEFASNAFTSATSGCIFGTSGTGAGAAGTGSTVNVVGCYFNGNSISSTNSAAAIWGKNIGLSVQHSIFYNNTGTKFDAIYLQNAVAVNISNTAMHSNSRHGINIVSGTATAAVYTMANIQNNIFTSNGGWGIDGSFSTAPTIVIVNHNAYYNNTSGDKTGFTAGDGEVTLTGLPYVNAPTNFALNAVAGQGLACRGKATPGTIGLSSVVGTGALDIGPLQHGTASGAYTFLA
jgi:hypothetical protein